MSDATKKKTRGKSTRFASKWKDGRPAKPYRDFPLSPHKSGKWCKKIRGKLCYFGRWAKRVNGKLVPTPGGNWEQALALYKAQADDLHLGRTPRVPAGELTMGALGNRFLSAKHERLVAGRIGQRTYAEHEATTDLVINHFGEKRVVEDIAAEEFTAFRAELAKRWGFHRLGNEIGRIRSLFKFAFDNRLMKQPMVFGSEFTKPTAAEGRQHKLKQGEKFIEAPTLRKLLRTADSPMRAMVLLGLNCGYGNTDVAELTEEIIQLDAGWIDYPRSKTGIPRRCPLWPETVEAIRNVLAERAKPRNAEHAELVFITKQGRPWLSWLKEGKSRNDRVSKSFTKLLREIEAHEQGLGFYTLRHVFRTVADNARDPVAIDRIMGHADHTMGARYRERIDDERLQAVVSVVRDWLWPQSDDTETDDADERADTTAVASDDSDSEPTTLRLFAGEDVA